METRANLIKSRKDKRFARRKDNKILQKENQSASIVSCQNDEAAAPLSTLQVPAEKLFSDFLMTSAQEAHAAGRSDIK